MYSGWPSADTYRAYPQYERGTTNSLEQSHMYGSQPIGTQPRRPLEPRPTLQTSHSEPPGLSRSQEAYRYQEVPNPEHSSRSRNLPGLKDILNSTPYSSNLNSYDATWKSSGDPSNGYSEKEGYRVLNGVHPPMVLHPPTTANQGYHPQLDRPYDVASVENNRHPLAPPISPYGCGFPDGARDYPEVHAERPKHASSGSMYSNGVPSPYQNTALDETPYRPQAAASYRHRTANVTAVAEAHGDYLGTEEVAGEGKYHIFADGYRMPTQVDGEQVNPAWGLTKANKARKRLALACLDCREKKIKCEPRTNSCVQCEKAMRPCRKAPEKYSQTETSSNYFVGSPMRKSAPGLDTTPSSSRNHEPDCLSKRRSRADPSPPLEANKRPRSISPRSDNIKGTSPLGREGVSPGRVAGSSTLAGAQEESLMWENDPYGVEPDITLHLLDLYFAHINNTTYSLFPRQHFMSWLKSYPHKCQNEKLALYAMLAAASIYADKQLAGFGQQCAQIAGDAISSEGGRFSISVAMSKMFLAMYQFAKGSNGRAWDFIGSAMRTVIWMNLHTEQGCLNDAESKLQTRFEFTFSPEQLAECKRRTFWSCFLLDRYCGAAMCMVKPQDIFVRLPCTEDMFERSVASDAPYFPNEITDSRTTTISISSPLAPMAWLIMAGAIWGDVSDFAFRAYHIPDHSYRDFYEEFYSRTHARAQDWLNCLPEHLQYSKPNLDQSIQRGYVGTLVSMHILYHLSLIKLNRYMRHAIIPDSVSRNIRTANHHGHQILQMMTAVHTAGREISSPDEGQLPIFAFTSQFPGYAVISAIDIVSAGGLDSILKETLDEIDGALGCLRELSEYWQSSKTQLRACEKRFYQLKNITITPKTAKSGCWIGRRWGIKAPLEPEFEAKDDCIYGLGVLEADEAMGKYFDAFKES